MKKLCVLFICCLGAAAALADPVLIHSCDRTIQIKSPPKRAVSHDINMTEMMFSLGLQSHMAGYSGITGFNKLSETFKQQAKGLPQLSENKLTLEQLLAVNADFLFAGWNYGLKVGGSITPATLKPFGITVYELTESCIHIMNKQPASFEDVYQDLTNLGRIFNVQDKAKAEVETYKAIIADVKKRTAAVKQPVRVFVYDSGTEAPFTAGHYAIPDAMITAAGGVNIMRGLSASWLKSTWEAVVSGQPEAIIIVNYGKTTAQQKIDFLKQHPALQSLPAIKQGRFLVLDYNEVTPGIRIFSATERLAEFLHPALYQSISQKP